jgi:hypothetical protein
MATKTTGVIRSDEAYSKTMVLERLGISQKFWDQMLDKGLPYAHVGHCRFVTGAALIEFLQRHSVTKQTEAPLPRIHPQQSHGSST